MKYYRSIDGLRFVAIMLVLIEHFAGFLGKYISAGYYGVDLFFVISGFLITSILLKENNRSFKDNYLNFLGRRTLRIFPIYYLVLVLLWILNLEDIRFYMLNLLTYTANYGMLVGTSLPRAPIRHLWSLSVEEQFYLFWPFVVLSLKRKQGGLTILVLGIILIGYLQIIYNISPSIKKYNYWGIFPRMSSLAMGALGALFPKTCLISDKFFNNREIEIMMLLLLIISLMIPLQAKPLLFGLCSLYLIIKASRYEFKIKTLNDFLKNRYVVFIGTISYGIYLIHPIIEFLFTKYIFDPIWLNIDFRLLRPLQKIEWHSWIIKFPLYSFLSISIAILSFKYIERPFLRLKDKLFAG